VHFQKNRTFLFGTLLILLAGTSLSFTYPAHAALYAFTSHTFTPCTATGKTGPTLANCQSAYSTSWENNLSYFNVTSGIQTWTAPVSGPYEITAAGAVGVGYARTQGVGAIIKATVNLTEGDSYKILVGQAGNSFSSDTVYGANGGGGGGGTFFTTSTNTPIIVAGGGGGVLDSTGIANATLIKGQTTTSGAASSDGMGSAGTAGGGGGGASGGWGGGGGGLTGNGTSGFNCANSGGIAFVNGGTGGSTCNINANGGFGGGGATNGNTGGGGGGGGYSGGGGSGQNSPPTNGGGGGSFVMAGATGISTSNGSYAGSSTGIGNLNLYNGTAGSTTYTAGYLTITFVGSLTSSTTISLPGSSKSAVYRTAVQVTATVDQPGRVTFYLGNKRISKCINIAVVSNSATCSWSPAQRGNVTLIGILTPNNGYNSSRSELKVAVTSRLNRR
jgi:hypothetical protein